MPARKPITNFSRGEFGPELYGRVDIPQYEAGAKKLKNFIVQRYGGAVFRPGFRFVTVVHDLGKVSLIPFQYSIEQSYVLVAADNRMTIAANGGMVIGEDLKITGVIYGNDFTTLTIPYHGLVLGDRLFLEGNTGPPGLNNRSVQIWSIIDEHNVLVVLHSAGYVPLTASTGVERVAPPDAPPAPEAPLPTPPPPPEPAPTAGNSDEVQSYFDGSEGGTYDVGGSYISGSRGYWSKLSPEI